MDSLWHLARLALFLALGALAAIYGMDTVEFLLALLLVALWWLATELVLLDGQGILRHPPESPINAK